MVSKIGRSLAPRMSHFNPAAFTSICPVIPLSSIRSSAEDCFRNTTYSSYSILLPLHPSRVRATRYAVQHALSGDDCEMLLQPCCNLSCLPFIPPLPYLGRPASMLFPPPKPAQIKASPLLLRRLMNPVDEDRS